MRKKITYFTLNTDDLIFNHMTFQNTDMINAAVHTHEVPEIIYIKQIDGCHIIEDREYILRQGDLILVPPAVHHCIRRRSNLDYERYDICFNPKILAGIDYKKVFKNIKVINCLNNEIITDIFKKTDYYAENFFRDELEDIFIILLRELFYNLSIDSSIDKKEAIYLNPILSDAIKYINANLFKIKTISEISKYLFITDTYLYEIFKKELNTSPKKYIRSKRLHFARQKILMGMRPTDACTEAGFNDYTSFYRNYVNFFGHSPSREKSKAITNEKYVDKK